jgi:hypothetical protein
VLRSCANADAQAWEIQAAIRAAWAAASAHGAPDHADLQHIAQLRMERLAMMQRKVEVHRAADLAATRVGEARLALEAAEDLERRLRTEVGRHQTAVAALRREVASAEQLLEERRGALGWENQMLNDVLCRLAELGGTYP